MNDESVKARYRTVNKMAFESGNSFYLDTNSTPYLKELFKDWPAQQCHPDMDMYQYWKKLQTRIQEPSEFNRKR
jgi:hypothetical protein